MTEKQRKEVLRVRHQCGQPLHNPPHGLENHWYHLSAACYEHKPLIGITSERMVLFEKELYRSLCLISEAVGAWCVLPNHYHVLVQSINIPAFRKALGLLHGRTSFEWNKEENAVGRKCWHSCLLKTVSSESHRWATINYIHHNPVHHGYVNKWQDWAFSSAKAFLETLGEDKARKIWKEYPLLNYGKGWDDSDV